MKRRLPAPARMAAEAWGGCTKLPGGSPSSDTLHSTGRAGHVGLPRVFLSFLRIEDGTKENGPAAAQHAVHGLLHFRSYFQTDSLDYGSIRNGFGRKLLSHVNGGQELSVPLGGERHGQKGKCGYGQTGPIRIARPAA